MTSRPVPPWALQHLRENMPALGQVLNVRMHRRDVVLANTRFGAVVVTKGRFGPVSHRLLPSPRERIRFACPTCKQTLEFRQLVVPADVHCGHCGLLIGLDLYGNVARPGPAGATDAHPGHAVAHTVMRPKAVPPVAQARCGGLTASGAPCHNLARPGENLCRRHARRGPSAALLAAEALAATQAVARAPATSGTQVANAARAAVERRMPEWAALDEVDSADAAPTSREDQLEAMKTTFINSAAHELQTPMTPLLLSLRTLETEPSGEPQQAAVRQAVRNAKRLEDVISNVVRVSQIQAGHLAIAPGPTDLSAILEAAAGAVQPRVDAAGLRIAVKAPRRLPIVADEARIREALDHLLSNAIRFSEPGGQITLTAQASPDGASFSVVDQGVGIDAADITRIFEPFVQLEAARMQTQGGLGLGLFFSRAIVEAHGGTLSAHSSGPGQGTRFVAALRATIQTHHKAPRLRARNGAPPSPSVRS